MVSGNDHFIGCPIPASSRRQEINLEHGREGYLPDRIPHEYPDRLEGNFGTAGFKEEQFNYLDDCRSFAGWKITNLLELSAWKLLHALGLHYPEVCLLGTYRKQ